MPDPSTKPVLKLPLFYASVLALITLGLCMHAPMIAGGQSFTYNKSWVPSLNLACAFRLDGLALIFAVMISFIGLLVFVYSASYMRVYANTNQFFNTLFVFALSMLGMVLADNLILLFIFWELTSITSYLLIATHHKQEISRRNALQAILVTVSGGLLLFTGFIWFGTEAGTFSLSEILSAPEVILTSSAVVPIMVLIIIGSFAKSAQFPYSFWLPNAMVAPTPVSTYLHSATMVKAGIYLLARLQPVFSFNEYWMPILAGFGLFTALYGSLLSLKQDDLKLMLAYTTLMALGTLTFLLGFASREMAVAAMVFMVAHALYKASLFMIAGIIEQHTGTRKRKELSGLAASLQSVRPVAIAAAVSMAGIPLFLGFAAKEAIYQALLGIHQYREWLIAGMVVVNACMVATGFVFGYRLFHGTQKEYERELTPPHPFLWISAGVAAYLGLALAIVPQVVDQFFVAPASGAVFGFATNVTLHLWHGFTAPLGLSAITLALGIGMIWRYDLLERMIDSISSKLPIKMETLYNKKLELLDVLAVNVTRNLHHGSLHFYLKSLLATLAASILLIIYYTHDLTLLIPQFPELPDWIGVALGIMAVLGAWITARATTKIMALAALGASGFAMAGIFLLQGALDVAMTQLLVETLVVVLAAAVLWRIPDFRYCTTWDLPRRYSDMAIAAAMGLAVYSALSSVLTHTLDLSVTAFYENASYLLAHGRNIVNVILVDFRAFDTMGETTVIAVAALAVFALMHQIKTQKEEVS